MIDSNAMFVATPETIWTMVELAQGGDQDAINLFVNRYATPMFCFLRQRGMRPEDAKDVVQQAFMRLFVDGRLRKSITRSKGRLRSYLFQTLRNAHRDWEQNRKAKKRLPEQLLISLEKALDEAGPHFEPVTGDSPDDVFDRRLARQALNSIVRQLQRQCEDGHSAHFAVFADNYLGGWSSDETGPFKDTNSLKDAAPSRDPDSDRWAAIAGRNEVPVDQAQNMCKTVENRMARLLQQEYTAEEISHLIAIFARAVRSERLGY